MRKPSWNRRRGVIEVIRSIQGRVAQKVKCAAVELIGSGLEGYVHHDAATAHFRQKVAGDQGEFLDRFKRRQNRNQTLIELVVVNTVQNVVVSVLPVAACGKSLSRSSIVRDVG